MYHHSGSGKAENKLSLFMLLKPNLVYMRASMSTRTLDGVGNRADPGGALTFLCRSFGVGEDFNFPTTSFPFSSFTAVNFELLLDINFVLEFSFP